MLGISLYSDKGKLTTVLIDSESIEFDVHVRVCPFLIISTLPWTEII